MAESAARKNLELSMKVTADTRAAAAEVENLRKKFGDAAADAQKLNNQMQRFNDTAGLRGQLTNRSGLARFFLGTPKADAESGEYLGQQGGLFSASGAAKIAGIAGVAATAANLTRAIQGLDSEFTTAEEKVLGFARAIPIIGGALGSLIANITDATDRAFDGETVRSVDRLRHENPILMAQRGVRSEFDAKAFGLRREVRDAGFRAQAVGEFATIGSQLAPGRLLMGGMGGAIGFGANWFDKLDPRMQQALEGVQAARREARAAELAAGAAGKDVDAVRPGAQAAMRDWQQAAARQKAQEVAAMGGGDRRGAAYDRTIKNSGGGFLGHVAAAGAWIAPSAIGMDEEGTNLRRTEALLKEQRAHAGALAAQQELEAKITANKQAQLALMQKQHEVAKAETNVLRVKYQLAAEEEAKMRGATRQFGMLDESTQEGVLNILRRFKAGGREAVTQEELNQLAGLDVTREFVGKGIEADARNNPVLKKILDLTGQKDLATLEQDARRIKSELDLKIQLDEEQFAKLAAEALKKLNIKDLLGEVVKNQLELRLRRPELDAAAGRIARAGG